MTMKVSKVALKFCRSRFVWKDGAQLRFDRILCDVLCTGDGTMRKACAVLANCSEDVLCLGSSGVDCCSIRRMQKVAGVLNLCV